VIIDIGAALKSVDECRSLELAKTREPAPPSRAHWPPRLVRPPEVGVARVHWGEQPPSIDSNEFIVRIGGGREPEDMNEDDDSHIDEPCRRS